MMALAMLCTVRVRRGQQFIPAEQLQCIPDSNAYQLRNCVQLELTAGLTGVAKLPRQAAAACRAWRGPATGADCETRGGGVGKRRAEGRGKAQGRGKELGSRMMGQGRGWLAFLGTRTYLAYLLPLSLKVVTLEFNSTLMDLIDMYYM